MSQRKEALIAKLLDRMSEEELEELLSDNDETDEGRHTIHVNRPQKRRRGKGHRKTQSERGRRRGRTEPVSRKNHKSKGRQCRSEPLRINKKRKNKFEELFDINSLTSDEKNELKEANKDDQRRMKNRKSIRKSKRPSTLVEVECRACGTVEEVSAALVPPDVDRYKCNECSGSACD